MGKTVKRAFDISDGLASIAHKKIKSLISELQHEGVMTKSESQSALKRLDQAKSNLYDAMSREFKKVLQGPTSAVKKATSKKKKSKR